MSRFACLWIRPEFVSEHDVYMTGLHEWEQTYDRNLQIPTNPPYKQDLTFRPLETRFSPQLPTPSLPHPQPHPHRNFPPQRHIDKLLPRQPPRRPRPRLAPHPPPIQTPPQKRPRLPNRPLLHHDPIQLALSDRARDEDLVDVRDGLGLGVGEDGVGVVQGAVDDGFVGGEEALEGVEGGDLVVEVGEGAG